MIIIYNNNTVSPIRPCFPSFPEGPGSPFSPRLISGIVRAENSEVALQMHSPGSPFGPGGPSGNFVAHSCEDTIQTDNTKRKKMMTERER